jgi:hypothetical protein
MSFNLKMAKMVKALRTDTDGKVRPLHCIPFIVSYTGLIHKQSADELRKLGVPEVAMRKLQSDVMKVATTQITAAYFKWSQTRRQKQSDGTDLNGDHIM